MATIGKLVVSLNANSAKLVTELTKSRKSLKKWAKKAGDIIKSVGKSFAVLGAAATAALTAIILKNTEAIKNIAQMSQAFNISSQSMQEWAYASRTLGFDAEKMGDIFKDVGDKVGDFFVTGGGPMVDVFQRLNLEAERFRDMRPDQVILEIARAMDVLGISASERANIWESVAGDLTKFDPLLRKGAEGFRQIAAEASEAGVVLSDAEVNGVLKFGKSLDRLGALARGFGRTLTGELAPALELILNQLNDWIAKSGGLKNLARETALAIVQGMRGAVLAILEFIKVIREAHVELIDLQAFWTAFRSVITLENILDPQAVEQKFRALTDRRDQIIRSMNDTAAIEETFKGLADGLQEVVEKGSAAVKAASGNQPASQSGFGSISSPNLGTMTLQLKTDDYIEFEGKILTSEQVARRMKEIAETHVNNTARAAAGG